MISSILHLQGKFWHFENVELKKFQDVWRMKEEEIAEVVKEVLMADKIIHEQQLGWYWLPPTEDVFLSPHNTQNAGETQEEPKDQVESAAGSEDEAEDSTKDEVLIPALDNTSFALVHRYPTLFKSLVREQNSQWGLWTSL